ncbi:MAG: DUF4937 domain-containing protein [Ignavibacteriaceae bacterium]
MYIKWINCNVSLHLKDKFSLAQEKWLRTKSAKGFVAQTGGWNSKDETEACIISFWENKYALQNFMTNFHDQIFIENNQDQFYSSIAVDHFNSNLTLEGEVEHFEQMQKEIWQPGMKNAKGMLIGYCSKSTNNTNAYLITTFWDSQENHQKYVDNILHGLIEKADVINDLETIAGKQLFLVDSWKILKDY